MSHPRPQPLGSGPHSGQSKAQVEIEISDYGAQRASSGACSSSAGPVRTMPRRSPRPSGSASPRSGPGRARTSTRRRRRSRRREIREGLERPSTWALLALSGGEPAGHVAITQAREREEPRPDIPGLAHFWMLFVRPPWWGSGLAARLNGLAVERGRRAGLRGDAPAHAGGEPAGAGLLRARGLAHRRDARSPSRCSGSTSWSTGAICEDQAPCSAAAGQPTPRRSPIAPRR